MWKKSSTDMEDPRRAIPKTDNVEPIRGILRSEREDPTWAKSRTDSADAKRLTPKTAKVEPKRREIPLIAIADPRCTKSNTAIDDPRRPKVLRDRVEPK
jgi:hypothetical protein